MTSEAGILLLENLLERLDADAATERPQFRGVVSDLEREALRSLVHSRVPEPAPRRSSTLPVERPLATGGAHAHDFAVELNTEAAQLKSSPAPDWILGLDFGTATSKAFAATYEEDPELLPLPIGIADGNGDGSVHEVSSSVWIDDEGLVFVGSEAVKRGMSIGDSHRSRLDSLKQQMSQVHPDNAYAGLRQKLPKNFDPTSTLTYWDAIMCYLAYLTDLATTELERDSRVGTRYVRRRFALPWWKTEQRRWAGEMLTKGLKYAQLLADTFHGSWREGIHVNQIKSALQSVAVYEEPLAWMVLTEPADGVLEALAASSARVIGDRSARDVMLVVDVGAGTTDLSLFWVVQRAFPQGASGQFRRAWPIRPCGTAIRQAGDQLDSLLVQELLRKADLGADERLKQRVSSDLFLRVRRLKETLFETGRIAADLVSDHTVTLTKEEFMDLQGVIAFEDQIRDQIQSLLDKVDGTWAQAAGENGFTLVLAGGGCRLPMVQSLKDRLWTIGKRRVKCRLAPEFPADLEDRVSAEFKQEYPRLTVAMGGALKVLLNERDAWDKWLGGSSPPRGLERFPMTGV